MALPLAVAGLVGGILGARMTFNFKANRIKLLFAVTSFIAAILMMMNALQIK